MDKLSIIIPTYNEAKWLRHSLPTIMAVRPQMAHEVIFINDCSTDDTMDVLAEYAKGCLVVTPEQRQGAARSRNLGASKANGNLICFLDAHVWPDPGFFDNLAKTALDKPGSIIVPGLTQHNLRGEWKGLPKKRRATNWGGGISFSIRKWWFYTSVNRTPRQHERRRGAYACGMTMTRELFDYMGQWITLPGFWSSSDVAMCCKAWMMDVPLIVETEAHHYHGIKGFGPHETPKMHEVLNRLYAARVLFASKTFRRFWLPAWKKRFSRHFDKTNFSAIINDSKVLAERDRFRHRIKHTDAEFLEEVVYPFIDRKGFSRNPKADFAK